jgi:hypothetical protein
MPSLRGSRPKSPDRPSIRNDDGLIIPSRTSSLHSRIAQPLPSALSMKTGLRAPKTLTHAYMVCGVGREPSQWVKAPQPMQGKIQHMKGAVGQFWLPEILGSSPRLEQDNEIARSLHAAVRVSNLALLMRRLPETNYAADAVLTDKIIGMLSPRCRDLHWQESASLCPSFIRSPARFVAYTLWYCFASMVSCRREAR